MSCIELLLITRVRDDYRSFNGTEKSLRLRQYLPVVEKDCVKRILRASAYASQE